MSVKFLNFAENLLITLLLVSCYFGFFFGGCVIVFLIKTNLTITECVLLMIAGIAATHGILRALCITQTKQRRKQCIDHLKK